MYCSPASFESSISKQCPDAHVSATIVVGGGVVLAVLHVFVLHNICNCFGYCNGVTMLRLFFTKHAFCCVTFGFSLFPTTIHSC